MAIFVGSAIAAAAIAVASAANAARKEQEKAHRMRLKALEKAKERNRLPAGTASASNLAGLASSIQQITGGF